MMVEILLIVVDILNVAEVLLISLFKSQSNVRILHCCILFYCCTVSSAFAEGDVTGCEGFQFVDGFLSD